MAADGLFAHPGNRLWLPWSPCFGPAALAWAVPLLAAWFLVPGIAIWISQPLTRREAKARQQPGARAAPASPSDLVVL